MYDGAVELRAGGGRRRVPIELEVFDFELPDQGSLTAMVYFERDPVTSHQGHDLTERFHRFAHRHRIELVGAWPSLPPPPSPVVLARDLLEGGPKRFVPPGRRFRLGGPRGTTWA